MTNPDPLGEPVTVIFSTTVYMGEILRRWSKEEKERFHNGDPEEKEAFDAKAAELGRRAVKEGLGDVEVITN